MTRVLIGADVDPRIPGMRQRPSGDIWDPLDAVADLERALGADLPSVTWLIRADDSIRRLTGSFESGYTSRRDLWDRLQARGHELGSHFHHWTLIADRDGFEPSPAWPPAACRPPSPISDVSSVRPRSHCPL